MRAIFCVTLLISLFFVAAVSEAAIYRWADSDGTVTFKDTPPPNEPDAELYQPESQGAVTYKPETSTGSDLQGTLSPGFDEAPELSKTTKEQVARRQRTTFPKVELYVTSWCGYCTQAKKFLRNKGVPFEAFDIEKNRQAARRHKALAPRGAVPVAVIGGKTIQGFSPEIYSKALGL